MLSADQQFETASHRLREAVARARRLAPDTSGAGSESGSTDASPGAQLEALAFNLERAAWAMLDLAQAWVFELRLGIPRKETESFDLLLAHGAIELDRARRYKQLCEFRSLSARERHRINWVYLQSDLSAELDLFLEWDKRVMDRRDLRKQEHT